MIYRLNSWRMSLCEAQWACLLTAKLSRWMHGSTMKLWWAALCGAVESTGCLCVSSGACPKSTCPPRWSRYSDGMRYDIFVVWLGMPSRYSSYSKPAWVSGKPALLGHNAPLWQVFHFSILGFSMFFVSWSCSSFRVQLEHSHSVKMMYARYLDIPSSLGLYFLSQTAQQPTVWLPRVIERHEMSRVMTSSPKFADFCRAQLRTPT